MPGGAVSAHAGIEMHAKIGDFVSAGDRLVTLFGDSAAQVEEAEGMLWGTVRFAEEAVERVELVREIVGA